MVRSASIIGILFISHLLCSCSDSSNSTPSSGASSISAASVSSSSSSSESVLITGQLNDTGTIVCANLEETALGCPQENFPAQDASVGRDAQVGAGSLIKEGAGLAGFDWTKLDENGEPLLVQNGIWQQNGQAGLGTHWTCVQDNVTGLMWEVKESEQTHPRYGGHTYSWFFDDESLNGGIPGYDELPEENCQTAPCHSQQFVEWVNQQGLCGYNDWRLPAVSDLLSLAVNSESLPAIDTEFFPNSPDPRFFTRNSVANDPQKAWYVYFSDASVSSTNKSDGSHLRLVRGAP